MGLFSKKNRGRSQRPDIPGGHDPESLRGYSAYVSSRPTPPEAHQQVAIATGRCQFSVRGMAKTFPGVDPDQMSPPLQFRATEVCLWTLNPDGSLYEQVEWEECKRLAIESVMGQPIWFLEGVFKGYEFDSLQIIPSDETVQAWLRWWADRGGEIDNRIDHEDES